MPVVTNRLALHHEPEDAVPTPDPGTTILFVNEVGYLAIKNEYNEVFYVNLTALPTPNLVPNGPVGQLIPRPVETPGSSGTTWDRLNADDE